MKKIVVIDNYDSFVFNLVRYVREMPGTEVAVMRNDQLDEFALEAADAILLSPGPGIPEEAGRLMEVIERFHAQKPLLGVCLGHQAIGTFFGAELVQCAEPVHGKSSRAILTKQTVLLENLPEIIEVGRYHSWKLAENLPESLQVTTALDDGTIMSIRHAIFPVEGIQFHPESILTPHGRTMINNWVNSIQKR